MQVQLRLTNGRDPPRASALVSASGYSVNPPCCYPFGFKPHRASNLEPCLHPPPPPASTTTITHHPT